MPSSKLLAEQDRFPAEACARRGRLCLLRLRLCLLQSLRQSCDLLLCHCKLPLQVHLSPFRLLDGLEELLRRSRRGSLAGQGRARRLCSLADFAPKAVVDNPLRAVLGDSGHSARNHSRLASASLQLLSHTPPSTIHLGRTCGTASLALPPRCLGPVHADLQTAKKQWCAPQRCQRCGHQGRHGQQAWPADAPRPKPVEPNSHQTTLATTPPWLLWARKDLAWQLRASATHC